MEEKTLLILAAGMGSRFGGLKQIEPIDENGNFIIDYSIYDAIKAGFNKVVFVIKRENLEIFKNTVGKRIEKQIKVEYAFQDLNSYTTKTVPGRTKPWGTGHAVLCAKEHINGDFAMINADDFYGFNAFKKAYEFIENNQDKKNYAVIGYEVGNTLTENGAVKRGVCRVKSGKLVSVEESSIIRKNGTIIASPLSGTSSFELQDNHPVSMNLICLNSSFFKFLQKDFDSFINNLQDPLKDEFLILQSMFNETKCGAEINVKRTDSVWYGVTYREDKPAFEAAIRKMVAEGKYPKNLWSKQNNFTKI